MNTDTKSENRMTKSETNPKADQKRAASEKRGRFCARVLQMLCFALAVWIGFDNHWSGLAWIPIGALLVVAISGFIAIRICTFLLHLLVVCNMYRLTWGFMQLPTAARERWLGQMDPEFREYFLKWIKKP
jgi:hypothetical protein